MTDIREHVDIAELFSGVVLVIDDQIDSKDDGIEAIVQQIQGKKNPIIKYKELPNAEEREHFRNLSFVILDWDLQSKKIPRGVSIPDTLKEKSETENIKFINEFSEICFCPIFIFTNEAKNDVENKLEEEGLFKENGRIFVESKASLQENKLFDTINDWLKKTPSMYVLKEWEKEYTGSKNRLFSNFDKLDPMWPCIMWKTFKDDGSNESLEMGDIISRNLQSRMEPFEFNEDILKKDSKPSSENLKKVLEGAKFLEKKRKSSRGKASANNIFFTGDIFYDEDKDKYFLNIRAQCDLIRDDGDNGRELYFIEGEEGEVKNKGEVTSSYGEIGFSKKTNTYNNNAHLFVVPFINGGKTIVFNLKKLTIKKWDACNNDLCKGRDECKSENECFFILNETKVGRLLPPYITQIQQKFASYIQREGVPAIPKEAVVLENKRATDKL